MTENSSQENYRLLIVDDDDDHVILIKTALKSYLQKFDLHVAANGLEALKYIQRRIEQKSLYDLILLDINMPLMNGYDFLKKIRREQSINFIPVIVLTTTDSPELLKKAYELGANTVIQKEVFFDPRYNVGEILFNYWLTLAYIPKA